MNDLTIDVKIDGRTVDRRKILKVGQLVSANGRYARIIDIGLPAEDGSISVDVTYDKPQR